MVSSVKNNVDIIEPNTNIRPIAYPKLIIVSVYTFFNPIMSLNLK